MSLAGAFVIAVVVLLTYFPTLTIGFWFDDFNHLEMAGRPSWTEFLISSFDPRVQQIWYRPVQQLQWRTEYSLFGGEALWYHLIQNLLHLLNSVMLFAAVKRLSGKWRAGLFSALIYSVLPTFSMAVYWVGVPDPLAAFFYLLAIWLWAEYLEQGGVLRFSISYFSFVLALFSKEVALTLPIALLLVDRWLLAQAIRRNRWVRRILPFFLFLPLWALLEWNVLANKLSSEPPSPDWAGWLSNMSHYLRALALPWSIGPLYQYAALLALFALFLYAAFVRNFRILALGAMGFVSWIPMASSKGGTDPRLLYLPLMASATGIGLAIDALWKLPRTCTRRFATLHLEKFVFALVLLAVVIWNSRTITEDAEGFSVLARQTRLQFQPIFRRHPAFEPGAFLYFVEPPFSSYNISGLMFMHYGTNVSVGGNDHEGNAGLRNYATSIVFYRDEQNVMREQQVDQTAVANSHPELPVTFGTLLRLEGFELVNTTAKHDEPIVLLLYWRALTKMDKNYVVFAHLLDDKNTLITSHDGPPRQGAMPTSQWQPGRQIVDSIILPITPDVPPGRNYRLALGMYDLETMQRLPLLNASHQAVGDTLIIESYSIEP